MIDTLLSIVAPHHCSGCGIVGGLLCENCKYDIIHEPYSACVACGRGLAGRNGVCKECTLPYQRAWCVAPRQEQLEVLINAYKFRNARAAYKPLAELLDAYMPELPGNVIIVPIPTIPSHIRQRGYDHVFLVARHFARARRLPLTAVLQRQTATVQRGAGARQRTEQAKKAYTCATVLDPDAVYLLVDDVMTTGATMKYAAKTLAGAGAQNIWVASISRQPLD